VAVLTTVKVEFTAAAPAMVTEAGFREQVTGLVAPAGLVVTAQVRLTVPVNPFDGVAVTVDVPLDPWVMVIAPLLLKPNDGGALTVTITAVVWVMLPDVPVTVNV